MVSLRTLCARGAARVPLVIWAATAAFVGLGALWSVTAPLGEAPDEPAHLGLVWHLAEGRPYPDFDQLESPIGASRLCATFAAATRACPRPGEDVTATSVRRHPRPDAPDRADRLAWDDRGGATAGPPNQMPQHPPGYYRAMAAVLQGERALAGEPWSADRELALLRLVNVGLVAPLPFLGWWAARRFGYGATVGAAAALVPFALPMLTHIGSTLNNDNLFVLCLAIITALAAGVVRGDLSRRTAVAIGLVAGVAFLTKGFAIVIPPFVLLAYLLGARARPPGTAGWARTMLVPLFWVGGLIAGLAGWWYVRTWRRTGQLAPTIESERLSSDRRPPGFSPDLVDFGKELGGSLNDRFWGAFGWYSVRFPSWLAGAATAVLVVLLVAALLPSRDEAGAGRVRRLALLIPLAFLGVFTTARAWDLYITTSLFPFIQGRYLFGGVVGLAVVAGAGAVRLVGRWAPRAMLGLAVVVQVEAFRRVLPGWWGGPTVGPREQVRALVAWSAWPSGFLALLALGAVGAAAALVWTLARADGDGGGGPSGASAASIEEAAPVPHAPAGAARRVGCALAPLRRA